MQIIIVLTVLIIAITSILYVVNDKFEKKEFIILLLIIIVSGVTYGLFEKNQSEFFPNFLTSVKALQIRTINSKESLVLAL